MDFAQKREALLLHTKEQLQATVQPDLLIIQALASVDDLNVQVNHLSSRLREWAGYVFPEAENAIQAHEHFARLLTEKTQEEIRDGVDVSMGADLAERDWLALKGFASQIVALYDQKSLLLTYIEQLLLEVAPNLHALLGTSIAARLISSAGSMRRLATMPASTVQLLGAEKALFRHLKSGARSPKHGHIVNHQLIAQARRDMKGKVARALGDKAAICAKLDYFKGDFLGEKYLQDLRARFS